MHTANFDIQANFPFLAWCRHGADGRTGPGGLGELNELLRCWRAGLDRHIPVDVDAARQSAHPRRRAPPPSLARARARARARGGDR